MTRQAVWDTSSEKLLIKFWVSRFDFTSSPSWADKKITYFWRSSNGKIEDLIGREFSDPNHWFDLSSKILGISLVKTLSGFLVDTEFSVKWPESKQTFSRDMLKGLKSQQNCKITKKRCCFACFLRDSSKFPSLQQLDYLTARRHWKTRAREIQTPAGSGAAT